MLWHRWRVVGVEGFVLVALRCWCWCLCVCMCVCVCRVPVGVFVGPSICTCRITRADVVMGSAHDKGVGGGRPWDQLSCPCGSIPGRACAKHAQPGGTACALAAELSAQAQAPLHSLALVGRQMLAAGDGRMLACTSFVCLCVYVCECGVWW